MVLASRNKGKLSELRALLSAGLGDRIELLSLDDVGITEDVEENGTTFAENALIKATAAAKASGLPALADDSGLVVYALNLAPGVYSARYAGVHGDDAANNRLLLENLADKDDRRAAFVCTFACVFPNGESLLAEGRVEGEILLAAQGDGGFGYDPLFYFPPMEKSFAEMTREDKNKISHRGAAVGSLIEKLAPRLTQGELC